MPKGTLIKTEKVRRAHFSRAKQGIFMANRLKICS